LNHIKPIRILLTNDDGIDSPLLHTIHEVLLEQSWVHDVCTLVPAYEKSWVAGAITRSGARSVKERRFGSHTFHLMDGTPADCTALGLGGYFDPKPDLVVSGINFGVNAGTCFFLGSGTIAGAKVAPLFGVRGVSCSASLNEEIFNLWRNRDLDEAKNHKNFFLKIARYQVRIIYSLLKHEQERVQNQNEINNNISFDFASINTPPEFDDSISPEVTRLHPTRFKPIFIKENEKSYRHKFQGFEENDVSLESQENLIITDIQALNQGKSSLSLFKIDNQGEIRSKQEIGNINLSLER